jgi:hypothetical protein
MNTELIRRALEAGLDAAESFAAHHPAWESGMQKDIETIRAALAELDKKDIKPAGMGNYSPCGGCNSEWCDGCKWERAKVSWKD